MNFKKIGTGLATAALLASVMAPAAFASTHVWVSGNGNHSSTFVMVGNHSRLTVSQYNRSTNYNFIGSSATTGGNNVNGNVGGGGNGVTTGKSQSSVTVGNYGNSNSATVASCGCASDTTVGVSGNGHYSDNSVIVLNHSVSSVSQGNSTQNFTGVMSVSDSGGNNVNGNVGGGGNGVTTDGSTSTVTVTNGGSSNTLN